MSKKVTLIHPTTGHEFEFDADHAARILEMPDAGGGWKRKEETENKTDAADGRRNKSKAKGATKQGDDKASD